MLWEVSFGFSLLWTCARSHSRLLLRHLEKNEKRVLCRASDNVCDRACIRVSAPKQLNIPLVLFSFSSSSACQWLCVWVCFEYMIQNGNPSNNGLRKSHSSSRVLGQIWWNLTGSRLFVIIVVLQQESNLVNRLLCRSMHIYIYLLHTHTHTYTEPSEYFIHSVNCIHLDILFNMVGWLACIYASWDNLNAI